EGALQRGDVVAVEELPIQDRAPEARFRGHLANHGATVAIDQQVAEQQPAAVRPPLDRAGPPLSPKGVDLRRFIPDLVIEDLLARLHLPAEDTPPAVRLVAEPPQHGD